MRNRPRLSFGSCRAVCSWRSRQERAGGMGALSGGGAPPCRSHCPTRVLAVLHVFGDLLHGHPHYLPQASPPRHPPGPRYCCLWEVGTTGSAEACWPPTRRELGVSLRSGQPLGVPCRWAGSREEVALGWAGRFPSSSLPVCSVLLCRARLASATGLLPGTRVNRCGRCAWCRAGAGSSVLPVV